MKVEDALRDVSRLFLDTAPVIYYVEQNPTYFATVQILFDAIDNGSVTAITSPITLAECLIVPYRSHLPILQQGFFDLIVSGRNTLFRPIDASAARHAAELRVRYNLTLTDALQVAVALGAGCQGFLTNDLTMKRVTELGILVVEELEL